jgi:N-acyl-D-amino-acid deacylase
MKKLLLLQILIMPLLCLAQWTSTIPTLDSALTVLYEQQLFNGTILVAEKGKVLYKKAFGIADINSRPLTTSSAFNLASVSKQFFAMMIMMLKEEGKLQYDDLVQKYLPSFPYAQITIRQLMNHTSGLPEYFDIANNNRSLLDTLTNASMLQLLAQKKPALVFNPGEKFAYCNTNYTTLASVIAEVSGIASNVFFTKRIVLPLKLTNTYIYNLTMTSYPASRVFGFHYAGGKPVPDDLLWLDGIVGDGNIYSSVEDLYKWDQALYTDKLVKQSTFKDAITSGVLSNGKPTNYGFGWFLEETPGEYQHSGGWAAFATYIDRYTATKQVLIVLDNSANGIAKRIAKNILERKPFTLPQTQLISNIQLIDGTGVPARKASVRIVNDRIKDIGDLNALKGEEVIDGKGYVLSPGFIDSHSHHEGGFAKDPGAVAVTNQGITTIVIGQDGDSYPVDTLKERYKSHPVSVNIATYTGHAFLRGVAMKGNVYRAADTAEITVMKQMLQDDILKGSFGLSTGLEYEEGFYSTREEVIDLAKAAAVVGGRYISHIRSEDINIENSIDEIIGIGREAKLPVQISHFKIAMRSKWGKSAQLLAQLQRARAEGINITADCYPYTMWSSTPRVLFPKKDFDNAASALYATQELFDPSASVITYFPANKIYEGKSVSEVAALNKETDAQALIRIVREEDGKGAAIAGASMLEDDVMNFLNWNYTNVCSDGVGGGHPRGYGAFTRVLARYVREKKLMPLETAVYKMTGLTAEHLGIKDRGVITPYNFADLLLFNPATVKDNATMTNPKELSGGIEIVWVNGKIVYRNQKPTGKYPGRFISRPGSVE